jgi:hypothetical protein
MVCTFSWLASTSSYIPLFRQAGILPFVPLLQYHDIGGI